VAAPAVAAAPVSKAVAATIHGRAVPAVAVAAAPAVAAGIHRGAISTVAAAPAVAAAATAPVAEEREIGCNSREAESDMGTVTGLTVVDALEGKSVVGTVTG
jgi:hypothetical protein